MTPPRETPPAPSLGEIAELAEWHREEAGLHGDLADSYENDDFPEMAGRDRQEAAFHLAAASHLRAVADVLGTLPDVRLGWHDYPAACIAFVARLRTALSDHQGGGE